MRRRLRSTAQRRTRPRRPGLRRERRPAQHVVLRNMQLIGRCSQPSMRHALQKRSRAIAHSQTAGGRGFASGVVKRRSSGRRPGVDGVHLRTQAVPLMNVERRHSASHPLVDTFVGTIGRRWCSSAAIAGAYVKATDNVESSARSIPVSAHRIGERREPCAAPRITIPRRCFNSFYRTFSGQRSCETQRGLNPSG